MSTGIVTSERDESNDGIPLVSPATTQDSEDSATLSLNSSSDDSGAKVYLNVYDLNPINYILSPVGFGLYHSGIQIDDCEYSYANRRGIFYIKPKNAKGVRFREQIYMGKLEQQQEGEGRDAAEQDQIQRALDVLREEFQPQAYDLVTKNCNHFCDALLLKLIGKPLPGHVNRMSYVWTTANIQGLVPKSIRQSAPTGDKNMKAYKGVGPFLASLIEVTTLVVREWIDASSSLSDMVTTSKELSQLLDDQKLNEE